MLVAFADDRLRFTLFPRFAYRAAMNGPLAQQFDVFAHLVATGNIAACSDALDLPAATVIETMNALEDLVGFQIFSVEEGGVELTDAGRKVVAALGTVELDGSGDWTEALIVPREVDAAAPALDPEPREVPPTRVPEIETVAYEQLDEEAPVSPKHFRPHRPLSIAPLEDEPDAPPRNDQQERRAPPASPAPQTSMQTITLASHPAIFSHFQEALLAFEEASPDIGITLMLESIDEDQAARLFYEGTADIAYYYALAEGRSFPSRYAWSERISIFVSADHPLAAEEALGAREIAALPYAALGHGNLSRMLAEEALRDSGLALPAPELETDDLYAIMKHLKEGTACFPAFGPMARDFGKMRGIARLAYASGLPQIQVRQAIRPALAQDPAVQALAEFLFR
ncbi:LysR substrate-binding domain-containing protein [Sphingobium sp. DEHP117]|uniref:LysR family transcriptional regulator n=1 Tax=Sphingobium sp. DEHP117 TaxID=2993436 RepID=UPI0027D5A3C4|nr:LysR substrate-binding domain-containing protein [Sphingobium sp. DEHP117]MDQ4419956.1 LysR substrate-binding domain-containing protein [Sphingobium sp. DEHP117]